MIVTNWNDYAQNLIKLGADPTIRNKQGRTANDLIFQHYYDGYMTSQNILQNIFCYQY
jgi:hypothetical protein